MDKHYLSKDQLMRNIITLLTTDCYERQHIIHMNYIGNLFGNYLHLSQKSIRQLYNAIVFHDIGKIIINNTLINKSEKLSSHEYELIKEHSYIGYWLSKSLLMSEFIALIILHHHERWDGKGYPYKLQGVQIPYLSRIITLIDSYEAMGDHRPYKKLMSKEEIIHEIKKGSNTQFDPILSSDFINFLFINNFPCYHGHGDYIECGLI